MAELPNSPPSASKPAPRPSGPVFSEGVAKVRITSAAPGDDYAFGSKTFNREGEMVSASSLGFDHDEMARAEADPNLVIERFDKDGRLVKKNGKPYPSVSDLTPPPPPKKES